MQYIRKICLFFLIIWMPLHALHVEDQKPQIFVVFGATGDLTKRKLVPALVNLLRHNKLSKEFTFIGIGRKELTYTQFCDDIGSFVQKKDQELWNELKSKITYLQGSFDKSETYEKLAHLLAETPHANHYFYLATPQSGFGTIVKQLNEHQLLQNCENCPRIIIEKPFGHDLDSALQLQKNLSHYAEKKQLFLIDHYLGKEMVHNLLSLRFNNSIFEPIWNSDYIENVTLTISEDIGIEGRGAFWEETGLLRDMIQSHAMQVISLIAMERPASFSGHEIRQEKLKVLEAIRPFPIDRLGEFIVRGQYGVGVIKGSQVPGYREESGVDPKSNVETFVAAKLFVDNPRWYQVPFFLKLGKRLTSRYAEVVIKFKSENQLIIRIQPQEEIVLELNIPTPGFTDDIKKEKISFNLRKSYGESIPEAYERLLYHALQGDHENFVSFDEHLATWRLYTPVLEQWQKLSADFPNYVSGSEGPDVSLLFK